MDRFPVDNSPARRVARAKAAMQNLASAKERGLDIRLTSQEVRDLVTVLQVIVPDQYKKILGADPVLFDDAEVQQTTTDSRSRIAAD